MAAKKKTLSNNPLTGKPPNTYTGTDQPLDAPKSPRKTAPVPAVTRKETSRRAEFEAAGGGRPELGYNKPEGMSHSDFNWMMGQHRTTGPPVPDINAPHKSDPYIVVNRRAEDLSGQEYQRGKEILRKHASSVETLRSDIGNAQDRSVASSIKAGAPRPAGQLFYGGKDEKGEESVPVQHLKESAERVVSSKQFPPGGGPPMARAMMTVGNSKTSPNVPFIAEHHEFGQYSPNNMAAEAAVHAGLENRKPPKGTEIGGFLRKRGAKVPNVGVGVYPTNMTAATSATQQLADGFTTRELRHEASGNPMFNPTKAPKTTDYQSAHQDPHGPDQKTVVDIHEGGNAFPHLGYEKSYVYEAVDHQGNTHLHGGESDPVTGETITHGKRTKLDIHPDELGPKGQLPHRMKAALPEGAVGWKRALKDREEPGDLKNMQWSKSRVEGALSEGKNIINAMVDHAARHVHAERGLSPSVNNAQYVHQGQASRWTQRQIDRPDMSQSIESEYKLPHHHEHMWSSTAGLHDAQQEDFGHADMHDLVRATDYNVTPGHPWAGISAPRETEDQSPDGRTPEEASGKTYSQRYAAMKPVKRAPDPKLRAAYEARKR